MIWKIATFVLTTLLIIGLFMVGVLQVSSQEARIDFQQAGEVFSKASESNTAEGISEDWQEVF